MINWAPLVRHLQVTNILLAAKLRLMNPSEEEPGTFKAYFRRRAVDGGRGESSETAVPSKSKENES